MVAAAGLAGHGRLEGIARVGYAARGVVYLLVGGLAVVAAFGGNGGRAEGAKGALRTLIDEPLGEAMLSAIAAGLAAHALWRAVQAIWDADGHGSSPKGLAVRGALLASAVTHVGLAAFALGLVFGWGASGGDEDAAARDWTAWLLRQPFGPWLVGAVGAAIVGGGIAQAVKGWRGRFLRRLDLRADRRRLVEPVCRFGLIARGAVFVLIGGFLLLAAVQHDATEARGLSGALRSLQGQPYGRALLGVVAVGLVAFAVYSLVEAAARRVRRTGPL